MIEASLDARPAAGACWKVFFALRPPPAVTERLEAFSRLRAGGGAALMPAARLHVSLNGLGAHAARPETLIRRGRAAADGLGAAPFVIAFNRIGSWGRGGGVRPVVLWGDDGVIGVERLHEALHGQLAIAGLAAPQPRAFAAHMTLWRSDRALAETPIAPVTWRVEALLLLASVQGEGRHQVLGRWTLGG